MGAGQSQEQNSATHDSPKFGSSLFQVVRIERTEIPEEYKTVGVSNEVVDRVLAMHGEQMPSDEVDSLREQLNHERATNERLREQMRYLSELQQRTPTYTPKEESKISLEEMEERKRVFNETVERVEQMFFGYQRENACESNEKEIMECLNKNKNRLLNCSPLVNNYENCVAEMRAQVLAEVGNA
uniref:CHCH domain-containing protein n=1 Tax=Ascaris lumbricoides TaxID=6252 RepID=A0A0M3INR6_ASCLU